METYLSFDAIADFKTTSSSKDWSNSVKVNGDHTSNGGSCYDVVDLLADAPQDSITQKINVERDELVFDGPLSAEDEAVLNTDVVSEKVDIDLVSGQVSTACITVTSSEQFEIALKAVTGN